MYEEQMPGAWAPPAEWEPEPQAASVPDAARRCRRLGDAVGATDFSLLFLVVQDEARRLAPAFDGSSPLSRALSARGADGLVRRITEGATPAWWRPEGGPPFLSVAARGWATEIESPLPGSSGIAFPVMVERGCSGVIAFAGDDMALDEAMLCETHARCFALFTEVARQRLQDCTKAPPVSKREIECLRLTANGLTSDEIAAALGLSVHTANQYLTNSTHKLNAVNRIHAVAKALRSGLID